MAVPRSILSRDLLPVSVAIFTAVAVVAFEGLAVTAALPDLASELGSVSLLPWVITAFLVASGVATAITGGLVDAVGTSIVFRWATIVFAVSSLGAAVAPSMLVLVVARVVQGAAGGAIISVGIAAVALVYPGHLTGRAFAANSNVWGVLGFAGPALAAAMLELGSWRWIFLTMVPLSLVALAAGWRTLPVAVEPSPVEIDWTTVGLLVVAVGATLGAVSDLSTSALVTGPVAVGAGTLLWRRVGRGSRPLVDRRFVTSRPYRELAAVASLTLAAMAGIQAYLPLYVRGARGGSASLAAWSVLWLTIGWTTAANIAGRATDRVSERLVLGVGVAVGPVGLLAAWATVSLDAPLPAIFGAYFLMGMSVGTVTNVALQLVKRAVPDHLAGRATSAHAFLRTLGLSIGAGLAGGVILAGVSASVGDVAAVRSALSGEGGGDLTGPVTEALAGGFAIAHVSALVLMGAAVAAAIPILRGTDDADGETSAAKGRRGSPPRA